MRRMNDFTSQQGVNPPEDTTDYSDDDVLIRREREREQLFEQQRQMNDAIAASNTAREFESDVEDQNEFVAGDDEYYDKVVAESSVEIIADCYFNIRSIALNTDDRTGAFNSFDKMMDNTKQVYKWLSEDAKGEVTGGPESASQALTRRDLPRGQDRPPTG